MVNGRRTSGSFAQVATPFASLLLFIPFANFRQTRLLQLPCYATFHQHTFPLSLLPPPRTGWHGTIRRYVFNESRSIVRDCSVRLASGPKIGEEGENRVFHVRHLAGRRMSVKWVPRGARRKREKGERERKALLSDARHGRERVSAREC